MHDWITDGEENTFCSRCGVSEDNADDECTAQGM